MRGINAQPRFLIIPRNSTKIPLTKNFRNPDCLKTIIFGIRDIKRKTDDERKSCWSCTLWIIVLSHRVLETAWKSIIGLGGWKFLSLTKTDNHYLRRRHLFLLGFLRISRLQLYGTCFPLFILSSNSYSPLKEIPFPQWRSCRGVTSGSRYT